MALAILLLFALPAQAQYVQGGAVNAAPDTVYPYTGSWDAQTSYSFTFAKPTTSPCTLMVSIRQPGMRITDSQKNPFVLVTGSGYGELWTSTSCFSVGDTVTVACPTSAPCWAQFTVGEYAGVWVADQVSPEITDLLSAQGWTAPITPTQNGELIIGIGSNHTTNTPTITPGAGWTLRTPGVNEFIEDMVQATAAPIASAVTYSAPSIWCQTTISFKPGGPPPPFVWVMPGFGTFTFPMTVPPSCSAADGTCSISVQACKVVNGAQTCLTLNPGDSGSVLLIKTAALPVPQTQTMTVVQAGP